MPRRAGMAQFSGCLPPELPSRRDAEHGAANRFCEDRMPIDARVLSDQSCSLAETSPQRTSRNIRSPDRETQS
jgi:hypothetical protein